MARRNRITNPFAVDAGRSFTPPSSLGRTRGGRRPLPAVARALILASLLCVCGAPGWAQKDNQKSNQEQMRGLDEQIQQVKSDVLRISAELSQLEEKLLYPSGTQVAIFVQLAKDNKMQLDAVRLKIDGQLATEHIYSFKELEALRKGGVQRIYVGNVATGDHQLDVQVDAKLEGGADFSHTGQFTFSKKVKPELVGLKLAGPNSGGDPITLVEW